jgi:rhodanese-related sulfurtransferase
VEVRSYSQIKFFVLDCRPRAQFDAGHLPCAYSLDAAMLDQQPEEMGRHVANLSMLKGSHFCFFAHGSSRRARQAARQAERDARRAARAAADDASGAGSDKAGSSSGSDSEDDVDVDEEAVEEEQPEDEVSRVQSVVLYLLSKGFKYISFCEEGYLSTASLHSHSSLPLPDVFSSICARSHLLSVSPCLLHSHTRHPQGAGRRRARVD